MRNPGRLLLGIGLLVAGVLFLLDLGDFADAGAIISAFWPVVVIAFGLFALFGPSRSLIGGGITIAAGMILLVASLDIIPVSAGDLILPLILIAVGAGLLFRRSASSATGEAGDRISGFTMFGGQNIVPGSGSFTGGTVTAVFGGTDVNLRSATVSPEGAAIETFVAFGAIEVIVPRGWRVTVNGIPLFAAFEDNIDRSILPEPDAPHLTIGGIALFGAVEVKHE